METEENSNPVSHQLGNGRVGCGPKQMHKHTSPHIAPSLPHDIGSKNEPQQNAMTDLDSVECMENIANAQVHMAETFVNAQQSGVRNVSVAQQPNNKNISQKYSTQTQHSDAFPVCHTSQLAKHDQKIASTVADTEIIPLYVWQNRHNSTDRQACIQQNGNDFGYIPVNNLHTYNGPEVHWHIVPDILQAHQIIRHTGVPNFLNARIPVATQLNPDSWAKHLTSYWDQQLVDLIRFGFPLDFDRNFKLLSSCQNHASAIEHVEHVDAYIADELKYGAMYGPFYHLPFPVHVSPLMTREKQDSTKRRTIMDLSWPKGAAVNTAIHKFRYLDTYFTLQYPSVDHIIEKLKLLGPGSLLYKVDISRAFRHLRIDPGDIDLLGIYHKNLFLDGSLPFGFRLGSGFFERCSDAIRYIMKQNGHNALFNYIDDLIYVGLPSKIHDSYKFLLSLLQDLGLEISKSKLVEPSTQVVCLGILVDTVNRTISVPPDKLQDIRHICKSWVYRKTCTKNQFQSLLGSLLYITKCIKPARFFLNRMLQILRSQGQNNKFHLTSSFYKDLNWFNTFLLQYNGVTYYDTKPIDHTIHLDSSLQGMGGVWGQMVYALPLSGKFPNLHITQLEMLNVVVALKVWANAWKNKKIQINCDNLAVVEVLNSGRTRDEFLATCSRNIWLLTSIFNIQLQVSHVPGKYNDIADLLSRWTTTSDPERKLKQYLPNFIWVNTHADLFALNFDI